MRMPITFVYMVDLAVVKTKENTDANDIVQLVYTSK